MTMGASRPNGTPEAATRKALDVAGAKDIQLRLEKLHRLREKELITEDQCALPRPLPPTV